MNKSDLVTEIAKESGITLAQANLALNATMETITHAIKQGEKVTLVGFGTFSIADRKARIGRNPKTGEEIKIKAKKVPRFSPGAKLKKAALTCKACKKEK